MSTELITRLKDLKLYGMAQCWPELSAKVRHGEFDAERLMAELCSAISRSASNSPCRTFAESSGQHWAMP